MKVITIPCLHCQKNVMCKVVLIGEFWILAKCECGITYRIDKAQYIDCIFELA